MEFQSSYGAWSYIFNKIRVFRPYSRWSPVISTWKGFQGSWNSFFLSYTSVIQTERWVRVRMWVAVYWFISSLFLPSLSNELTQKPKYNNPHHNNKPYTVIFKNLILSSSTTVVISTFVQYPPHKIEIKVHTPVIPRFIFI